MKDTNSWTMKKGSIKYYNATANSYNQQYREEQYRKYEAALDALRIVKKDSILDVGCGTGMFIKKTSKEADLVIGVDISRRMVELANKKCKNLKNVLLICGDADHLSLKERIIDKAFSFTLLQNISDPRQMIREIIRVTKADSKIILSADKRAFTREGFRKLLREVKVSITHFITYEDLKGYIAICTKGSR